MGKDFGGRVGADHAKKLRAADTTFPCLKEAGASFIFLPSLAKNKMVVYVYVHYLHLAGISVAANAP